MSGSENWQEIRIPIRGRIMVQFDSDQDRVQHVVANFEHYVPVRLEATDGIPTIKLNEKWEVNPVE